MRMPIRHVTVIYNTMCHSSHGTQRHLDWNNNKTLLQTTLRWTPLTNVSFANMLTRTSLKK